jgi:hypothetical protein
MVEHDALPECIDRLARIETDIHHIKDNDLIHIETSINGLEDTMIELGRDIKATQKFVVGEGILVVLALMGMGLKILL